MQQHIQEAYQTNLQLHGRTTQQESAFQNIERLFWEREQQIHELEEILKIRITLDDQLATKHRMIMVASSNIVSLALEHRTMDQMLTYYFSAITATSVQYSIDLTHPSN